MLGDVNGDGEIGFTDVSALYGYLTGADVLSAPLAACDLNYDGDVTFADISELYGMIIG